jgi:hypothetical protein
MSVTVRIKTFSDAEAAIDAARNRLFKGLVDGKPSEQLAGLVNQIAELEGQARALAHAEYAIEHNDDPINAITFNLLRTDDTWSGRTNDVRRAFFDGVLDALHELQWRH